MNVTLPEKLDVDLRDALLNALNKMHDVKAPSCYNKQFSSVWAEGYNSALNDVIHLLLHSNVNRKP